MMRRTGFVAVSMIIVVLMYLVPYFVLNGTVGPQTLLFWTLISAAYLVIVVAVLRGDE